MDSQEKTKIKYIYKYELASAIAKAILIRGNSKRFPDGIYQKLEDGTIKIDETGNEIFSDKAAQQLAFDYFYYQDLIEKHIVSEVEEILPEKITKEEKQKKDTIAILKGIKALFRVF